MSEYDHLLAAWRDLSFSLTDAEPRLRAETRATLLRFAPEAPQRPAIERALGDLADVEVHPFDSGNDAELAKWDDARAEVIARLAALQGASGDALPPDVAAYKRTRAFDQTTLPAGLRAEHSTKPGVWGLIVIERGAIDYTIRGETKRLTPAAPGVVPPEVPHHLTVAGPVMLRVVFYRRALA